jgi:hypothetical protein
VPTSKGGRAGTRARGRASRTTAPRPIATQIALRYRATRLEHVRSSVAPYGSLEVHARSRILIVHRAASVPREALAATLRRLERAGDIEFASAVVRDPRTGLRQVLTDEIVVRLKPGTARQTLATLKAEHGLTVCRRNAYEPTQFVVRVPDASGMETLEVARSIDERDDVEYACPNFLTDIER